ncbi:MAG: acyl-CoA dehydrogenase family protein, partial [Sphingobium sp.]
MTETIDRARAALSALHAFGDAARDALAARVVVDGRADPARLDAEQRAAHGYAWVATTIAALDALAAWAQGLAARGEWTDGEALVLDIAFGEYAAQLIGGLPMSANEFVRPAQLGLKDAAVALASDPFVAAFVEIADDRRGRAALIAHIRSGGRIAESFGDDMVDTIRDQYRRFTADRITPHAHRWHLENALIPDALIAELAALGTFGVCISEDYGGLGLGKLEMCVVTEELSRGWIGAGSLGTRSEIAGELIGASGTDGQKAQWLPGIAAGTILPTAVFTEPSNGSDLANLASRATRAADGDWRVTG